MSRLEGRVDPSSSVQRDLNADHADIEEMTFSHKEAAVFSTMSQQNAVDISLRAASLSNIKTMEQSHGSLGSILHLWCSYCEFSTDNKKELVTHMHGNHMKPCSFCSFRSLSQADLTKHVEYEHGDRFGIACSSNAGLDTDPVSMCEFCSFMTYSTEHLQKHTYAEHTGMQPKHTAKWIPKTISAKVRKADAIFYSNILDEASDSEISVSRVGKNAVNCEPELFSNDIRIPVQGLPSVEAKDIPHWSEHPPSTNQNKINYYYNSDDAFTNNQSQSLIGNSVDFDSQSSGACDPVISRNFGTNFVTVSASNPGLELKSDSIKKDQNLGHPANTLNTPFDREGQSSLSECQESSTPTTSRTRSRNETTLIPLCNDHSISGNSPLEARAPSKPLKSKKLSKKKKQCKSKKNVRDNNGGNGVVGGESQQIKLEHGHNDETFQRQLQALDSGVMTGRPNLEMKTESSGQESDDDDEPHVFFSPENDKEMQEDQNSTSVMAGKHQDSFPSVVDLKAFHPCNLCSLAFSTSTLLEEHTAKQHKEDDSVRTTRSKRRYVKRTFPSIQLAESQTNKSPVKPPKRKRVTRERKRPIRAQGGETPFKCEDCGKCFTKSETLHYHMTIHTGEKKFSCDECGRKFRWSSHLRRHEKLHRGERKFKCTVCSKSFVQGYTLVIHMRSHTGERPYKCSYCDKGFKSKYEHIVHTRIHTGEKPYKCKLCDKSYAQSSSLDIHMRSHTRKMLLKQEKEQGENSGADPSSHGNQRNRISAEKPTKPGKRVPQPCRECGKLLQPGSLWRHLRTHTGIRPYKCSKCGHDFLVRDDLKKHVRMIHTKERPYQCHMCEKNYKDGHNLKRHIRSHTGEKPFKCTECDKCYQNVESLRVHMSIHTGEQRLLCNICGKHFRWGGHLRRHMKIHTGERPYECIVCGSRFGQKTDLHKHMTIHTEKPYKCSICAQTFRSNSTYQNHVSKHPGGQRYSCTMCDRSFHRRGSLQQHVRRIHNRKTPQIQAALLSTMVSL